MELKTFKSYGVDEILGFKTEEKDGRNLVYFRFAPEMKKALKNTPSS